MLKSIVFVAVLLVAVASATKVDYSGHMVLRVVPETQEQIDLLLKLAGEGTDFWDGPGAPGTHADFRVSPTSYYNVVRRLAEVNLSYTIRFRDIGQLLEREQQEIALRKAIYSGKAFDFANYHNLSEIEAYLIELDATSNGRARLSSLGRTYENRDIWGVRISSGGNKPLIYADCAMHCREWVATASCLWMIEQLVNNPSTEAEAVLSHYDIIMVPVSNPDGYVYTWTDQRLWRKNRQPTPGATCIGTDPDRNFDSHHCEDGSTTSPCSGTFCGPSPFSSQEAAAVRDVIVANRRVGTVAYVSIQSYSQQWMSVFGFTANLPFDYSEIYRVMNASVKALETVHGTQFTYGSIANVAYAVAGSSIDWAYETEKIRYSYAVELRDTGEFGFELPVEQIIPTAEETYAGLLTMAREIAAAASL